MSSLALWAALDASARCVLFCRAELVLPETGQMYWDKQSLRHLADSIQAVLPVTDNAGTDIVLHALLIDVMPDSLNGAYTVSTRTLLLEQGFDAFSLVGRASQWINWFRSHRHCGFCGGLNELRQDGRLLHCVACAQDFYPRINPCIIVLVTDGERILLARSQRRGAIYFSCLAGFIEPGETVEQAVAREVYEEAGIHIKDIRYVKSQPWPFPSQLMLGFYATYAGGELNPCPVEIAEANWYHVNALPATPAPDISVAGQLIAGYCQQYQHHREES